MGLNTILFIRLHPDLNERQMSLLGYFHRHPEEVTDIRTHRTKHGVVYETARRDLAQLEERGLLAKMHKGNKMVFMPNIEQIRKLLE